MIKQTYDNAEVMELLEINDIDLLMEAVYNNPIERKYVGLEIEADRLWQYKGKNVVENELILTKCGNKYVVDFVHGYVLGEDLWGDDLFAVFETQEEARNYFDTYEKIPSIAEELFAAMRHLAKKFNMTAEKSEVQFDDYRFYAEPYATDDGYRYSVYVNGSLLADMIPAKELGHSFIKIVDEFEMFRTLLANAGLEIYSIEKILPVKNDKSSYLLFTFRNRKDESFIELKVSIMRPIWLWQTSIDILRRCRDAKVWNFAKSIRLHET